MFLCKRSSRRSGPLLKRCYAARIDVPFPPPAVPVVDSCPKPTCPCRASPAGLEIEREQNINGSMPTYAEQILICTGRSDWKSRIDEEDEGILLRGLKSLLGPKGKYRNPYHNVMLTNSSFPPAAVSTSQNQGFEFKPLAAKRETRAETMSDDAAGVTSATVFLLPSFRYIPAISTESTAIDEFVRGFVLPSTLDRAHDVLSKGQRDDLIRQPQTQRNFVGTRDVTEILVLICGHGGRDERCGRLGPVLKAEFEEKLQRRKVELLHEAPAGGGAEGNPVPLKDGVPSARVGLISHIGGHKWAGNVIIYIPPLFASNSLAGRGIWYGRVAPEHIEGIVDETILGGRVIKDLFRGGIDQGGQIIRL